MFNADDLNMHRGLVEMINKAEFPLKRRELRACEAICNWAINLDKKIEACIRNTKPVKSKATIKKTGSK
jgi:hypothetical protein